LATVLAITYGASPASADAVDTAVAAFSIAGSTVGITLNDAEKTVVKAILRCVGAGIDGRKFDLGSCARGEVVRRLPATVRPLVDCVLKGRAVDDCAVDRMLDRLPAESRAVVQCVAAGTPLTRCGSEEALKRLPSMAAWIGECVTSGRPYPVCAGQAASKELPTSAKPFAACLSQRADFGRCAKSAPAGSSHRQALQLIDKLKADNRTDLGNTSTASIRNMIHVADGIRENDWIKVGYYGGVEVYKAAAKIILNALLTPVFQPLIGPIADAVIQHRADLFARLVTALKNADEGAVAEVAIEGYLIIQIEVACALPMPEAMREALCGTLGKIIKGVADVGGDVADLAGRLIEDPLGIPSTLWDETQRARERLAGKAAGCDSPPIFYAETYARCYQRGAKLMLTDPQQVDTLTDSINGMCREYYDGCYFSNRFDGLCNPQREMFLQHSRQISQGLEQAAAKFARGLPGSIIQSISDAGDRVCLGNATTPFVAKTIDAFKTECARSLKFQMPVRGSPLSNSCGGKFSLRDSAQWFACERAVDAVPASRAVAQACRATWSKDLRLGKPIVGRIRPSLELEDNPRIGKVKPSLTVTANPSVSPNAEADSRTAPQRPDASWKAKKSTGVSRLTEQGAKKPAPGSRAHTP
jgi:hypothetical protein